MRKGYDAAEAEETLARCAAAGITVSVNLVTGFPGETWLDWLETVRFVRRNAHRIWNRPGVTDCAAIPGSELHDHPERFGVALDRADRASHYTWRSLDGYNTNRLRTLRKRLMNAIFARTRFQEDLTPR